jgi:hypothetical protein
MFENWVNELSPNVGNQLQPTPPSIQEERKFPLYCGRSLNSRRICRFTLWHHFVGSLLCAVLAGSGISRYLQTQQAKVLLPYVIRESVNFRRDVVFISGGVGGYDSHKLRRFPQTHKDSLIHCLPSDYLNKSEF